MMDYPCAKPSLVIVLSAILVLSCGQTEIITDNANCFTPVTVGVSNYKNKFNKSLLQQYRPFKLVSTNQIMNVILHAQLGSFWKLFRFKILCTNHNYEANLKSFETLFVFNYFRLYQKLCSRTTTKLHFIIRAIQVNN